MTVGNPGNANDRALDNINHTPGNPTDDEYASPYGGVAYTYRMGVYEISQDQIDKAIASGQIGGTLFGVIIPATCLPREIRGIRRRRL